MPSSFHEASSPDAVWQRQDGRIQFELMANHICWGLGDESPSGPV